MGIITLRVESLPLAGDTALISATFLATAASMMTRRSVDAKLEHLRRSRPTAGQDPREGPGPAADRHTFRSRLPEFLRFAIVGGLSAAAGWLSLYCLVHFLRWNYLIAYAATFLGVNSIAYLAAGTYAFKSTNVNRRGLARYFSINLASLVGNGLALAALVEWAHLNYLLSAILLSALNAPINFLLHRRLTFGIAWRERGASS